MKAPRNVNIIPIMSLHSAVKVAQLVTEIAVLPWKGAKERTPLKTLVFGKNSCIQNASIETEDRTIALKHASSPPELHNFLHHVQ